MLKRKLSIAVVEPYIGGVGGAQKVIAAYSAYLKSKGHKVEIFSPRIQASPYKDFDSIKINSFGFPSKFFSPWVFANKKFKDFDLIIANDFPSYFSSFKNDNVLWICYSPKRDFYDLKQYTLSNSSVKGKILLRLKEIMLKRKDYEAAHKVKKIMPISKEIKSRIENYYGMKTNEIFYSGLNTKEYCQGETGDYLLSVARFVKPKRVDLIIESMRLVKNKSIKLYLVGDGTKEEMEHIKELSAGLPQVKIIGKVDEIKLRDLYSNCLAAVYVPLNEDWGLVPLEAAASGKPTIGVNEGGLKETIINGKTGFLLNEASQRYLAEKIDYLADNPQKAKELGNNALRHSKKFDWSILLPKFEKILLQTASAKSI